MQMFMKNVHLKFMEMTDINLFYIKKAYILSKIMGIYTIY